MEENKLVAISSWIIVIFIGGVILRIAKPVLFPFFLAIFLYFILSPVIDFLTRLKVPRAISIIFILLVTFFVLYLLGVLFYSSGKAFASEFPKYGQKISSFLESLSEKYKFSKLKWNPGDLLGNLDINKIGSFILSALGPFFTFIEKLFLVFIFLIFMLAGRGKMKAKVESSFSKARASKIISVIDKIDNQIQRYIAIKTVVSLTTGLLTTLILVIFGVNFAIVFGFLTFLLNYVPTIGSIISIFLPVAIAAIQFWSFWPAFWILIILVVVDNVLANFVEPKLMGQGLGLSSLLVLFSLIFWAWLWGIPGMILAIPIVAIIKIILSNIPSLRFIEALMSK